ncbi:MAG: sulfotransferase [Actinomycetota bacterium]
MPEDKPLVLVTVGTDAFAFDRLMRWLQAWLGAGGSDRARVLVQCGSSTPPDGAESVTFLPYADLQAAEGRAVAVVCHGAGPTILEILEHQLVPIVVPRRRAFGEAVDDHQVLFTKRLASEGRAMIADSADELSRLLDRAIDDPTAFRLVHELTDSSPAVESFAAAVTPLLRRDGDDGPGRPRVLFIAGTERSGSTLLERLLGEVEGFCSGGELVHLWERGLAANQLCGCGVPFRDCSFWAEVGREAFGGWDALDPDEMVALKHQVDRHRYLPLMALPDLSSSYRGRLERFSEILAALYRAIAEVSGSTVVDSSKSSSYLFVLRTMPEIDLRMLHLIRDSRGVAYSATKRVRRPEVDAQGAYMPSYHPARAGVEWLLYNTLFDVAGTTGTPSMHLRYESLVTDARRQVGRVLRFAGVKDTGELLGFLGTDTARLQPIHSVSGNPMRFRSGETQLRLDDEWRVRLAPKHRAMVSFITWPLMRRYGYALRS